MIKQSHKQLPVFETPVYSSNVHKCITSVLRSSQFEWMHMHFTTLQVHGDGLVEHIPEHVCYIKDEHVHIGYDVRLSASGGRVLGILQNMAYMCHYFVYTLANKLLKTGFLFKLVVLFFI